MKTNIATQLWITDDGRKTHWIELPQVVLDNLGWKTGDELTLDIPMVHKGMLCVEKKG